jgi:hypothetical protein
MPMQTILWSTSDHVLTHGALFSEGLHGAFHIEKSAIRVAAEFVSLR